MLSDERDTENYPLMFVLFLIKMTCWPSTLMTSPVGRPSPNCQANVIRPPSKLSLSTLRDTECYATEIEQSALGAMTKPIDQVGAFITAVVLFGNVIPRIWPARILLVEVMQFRKMALGSPLLSITRNAAEWLANLNDSVTLLLSFVANVLNGDTECSILCPTCMN